MCLDENMNTNTKLTYNHSRKTNLCANIGYGQIFINFPLLFPFTFFLPNPRTPHKSFQHSFKYLPYYMDKKEVQPRSPFKMLNYPSTCPYIYNSNLFLFVINPQHQPLIKSITNKNILPAMVQALAQRKLIQQLQISTSSTYHLMKTY